ncbi:hypothetical protein ACFWAX_27760 [Streptomyces sp. NPDC059956]|uniref:hypothetical protein n=1 Tax=Streptomyces sp. NPDC059956 TaxID=3347015 RepID=UPI0036516F77
MDHDVAAELVEEWPAGPNSEASGHFSYQALAHYRPAVLHWLTVGCGAGGGVPDADLYLRPTPAALQDCAVGYAGAARSRDAACGAVPSFYRWLETPAAAQAADRYHGTRREGPQPVHHDAVRAIDEYLPHRVAALPDTGHLFTTVNGRPLEPQSLLRILRSVAVTHPDLEETACTLSADAVTHSPAHAASTAGPSGNAAGAGGTRGRG